MGTQLPGVFLGLNLDKSEIRDLEGDMGLGATSMYLLIPTDHVDISKGKPLPRSPGVSIGMQGLWHHLCLLGLHGRHARERMGLYRDEAGGRLFGYLTASGNSKWPVSVDFLFWLGLGQSTPINQRFNSHLLAVGGLQNMSTLPDRMSSFTVSTGYCYLSLVLHWAVNAMIKWQDMQRTVVGYFVNFL